MELSAQMRPTGKDHVQRSGEAGATGVVGAGAVEGIPGTEVLGALIDYRMLYKEFLTTP